jgi:hypothetical protein
MQGPLHFCISTALLVLEAVLMLRREGPECLGVTHAIQGLVENSCSPHGILIPVTWEVSCAVRGQTAGHWLCPDQARPQAPVPLLFSFLSPTLRSQPLPDCLHRAEKETGGELVRALWR